MSGPTPPDDPAPSWPPATPTRWSLTLPQEARAVGTARAAVGDWLAGAPARLRDDARTVVSELVANAVRYGQAPIRLSVERTARGFRIDVADAGARRPAYSRRSPTTGWGLRIVDALAERWSIADDASRVWCILERDDEPPRVSG